jgi:signal transduction histidine kinase
MAKDTLTSLRWIMYRRIVVWMLLCGFVASGCVFFTGEALFRNIYARTQATSLREAESRLALFDSSLALIEKESLATGRLALGSLARIYGRADIAAAKTAKELADEARKLGVTEVYFIDSSGKVFATSFPTDLGLDLLSVGKEFASFIKSVYGKGEIVDQRISNSTLTGKLNNYQYFSPKGSDFIIEVSTRLDQAVERSLPKLGYDGFMSLANDALGVSADAKPLARIVDIVGSRDASSWSLFQNGIGPSPYAYLVARARKGETAVSDEGNKRISVKEINFSTLVDFHDSRYFVVFQVDLGPLRRFRLIALSMMIAACGVATGISFALMKRSFDLAVATRIDGLRSAIARAAEGDYGASFDSFGDDEIGAIGASVGSMVRTILDKEERLRAAERMETAGAMAGGLAHDFSNILTGISGTIECMELSLSDGEVKREELLDLTSLASKTARRGGELVRALLDLSSPRPSERGPIDLCAIAREAAELSLGKEEKGISIRVETPETPLIVHGDARSILRAAINLCNNGIQAMTAMRAEGEDRGGHILIRAEARPGSGGKPDEAALVVRDEGVGIAPEERGKIFVPFYSTKPRGLGSGIGLSIVLSAAKSHGGRLELESEPGRGSTFTLILPA